MEEGYLLNEKQAILTAILSDTPVASKVRLEIVHVIYALRHGDKIPPMPTLPITRFRPAPGGSWLRRCGLWLPRKREEIVRAEGD
jgi:hypothetical protein